MVSTTISDALRKIFGFDSFRPGQEEVISHLMAGRSAVAVFPTGGGKSLCYQLPALELDGLTLVVSPLIALMKDQIDALRSRGVSAARLDSSLGADETREVLAALREGSLRLLYVAPERFNNERFRAAMESVKISLFTVDEAHCISEWGHNFRPDYLKLAGYAENFGAERVLALTATATPKVLDDICAGFRIPLDQAVRTGFHRPNLQLLLTPIDPRRRDEELIARLRDRPPGSTIVYVTQQRTAEQVAERLAAAGFEAAAYHAGMKSEDRGRVQDAFMGSDRAVVVATIAFGMGIDKSDIRYVYHYNPAKSLENLSQEIGRAGRDGEPSICESLLGMDDLDVLRNFVYGDTPSRAAIRGVLGEVFETADEEEDGRLELSLYELSARHDVRSIVLRTLLTYLELEGFLEAGTPTYSSYRFKPLMSSKEILERFQGERRDFLRSVFREAKKARVWLDLDLPEVGRKLRVPRERLVTALDYLAEQEMIELKVGGVRHRYRRVRRPDDLDMLADVLYGRALKRERREIARLQKVLDLAAIDACQSAALCKHFGEALNRNCGQCSWCVRGEKIALPEKTEASIDEDAWNAAVAVRDEHPDVLGDARAFARFLCGIPSPKASRKRLGGKPQFGRFAEVPFNDVLRRVEAG